MTSNDDRFDETENDEMENDEAGGTGMEQFDLRHLSPEQLGRLGVSQIAYVKPVVVNGAAAFAIHAADGTPMAIAPDQALAFAAIVQHEMVPAFVQ
jgi:hypothetical protein